MERDAKRWAIRLGAKERPLRPGEAAQLRSFITSMRALGTSVEIAEMAAFLEVKYVQAAQASAFAAVNAIPQWAEISASDAAAEFGWSNIPNTGAIKAAAQAQIGLMTGDFTAMSLEARGFLIGQLTTAVAAGEGPRELAKRISGVVDTTARRGQARSVMIARTALARVYDTSSQEVYRYATEQGVMANWRWVAQSDACPVCAALNGMIFPTRIDTYRHPNCRCVMVPVTRASEAFGTPVGERFDPFPDTEDLVERLELQQSPSGFSNWRIKPKHPQVKRPTWTLKQVLGEDGAKRKVPEAARVAPKKPPVRQAPEPAAKTGLVEQELPTSLGGRTVEEFVQEFPWLENELRLGDKWMPEMLANAKLSKTRFFFDPDADILVKLPRTVKPSAANLKTFLDGLPDAVQRGRVNMPLRAGETKVRRSTFNFETKNGPKGADAYTYTNGQEIWVNRNQFQLFNPKSKLATDRDGYGLDHWSAGEYMPKGQSPFNTIVHEMGHNADRTPPGRKYDTTLASDFTRKRNEMFKKWELDAIDPDDRVMIGAVRFVQKSARVPSGTRDILKGLVDGPTIYGRTNPAEMWAEAYTAWAYRDVIKMGPRMRAWVEDYAREFGWR